MTISDFCEMFTDLGLLTLHVWNLNYQSEKTGDMVWSGRASDVPFDLRDVEICSIEVPDKPEEMTVNVDLSEDELDETDLEEDEDEI